MLHRYKHLMKEIDEERYWYEEHNYLPELIERELE